MTRTPSDEYAQGQLQKTDQMAIVCTLCIGMSVSEYAGQTATPYLPGGDLSTALLPRESHESILWDHIDDRLHFYTSGPKPCSSSKVRPCTTVLSTLRRRWTLIRFTGLSRREA